MKLNRRAFLGGAAVAATAAVIPFTAASATPALLPQPEPEPELPAVQINRINTEIINSLLRSLKDHGLIA